MFLDEGRRTGFRALSEDGGRRRGGTEVRGDRLEVRKPRSFRSSDLSPLTSSLRLSKDGSTILDEGRRTALRSSDLRFSNEQRNGGNLWRFFW